MTATPPTRPDTRVPAPAISKPSRRRSNYVLVGIVLGALVLVAVLVIVPIVTNATHPTTAVVTSDNTDGCTAPGVKPTRGALDLASVSSDTFVVTDANTGATLAVSEAVQPIGGCRLNLQFNVPYSAHFVEISDTSKPQVRWGPVDMRQIAAHNWTVYLTADLLQSTP